MIVRDEETGEVFVFEDAVDAERFVDEEDAAIGVFAAWDAEGLPLRFELTPRPGPRRSRRELLFGSARQALRPVALAPLESAGPRPEELRSVLAGALAGGGLGVEELAGRPLAELVDEGREKLGETL